MKELVRVSVSARVWLLGIAVVCTPATGLVSVAAASSGTGPRGPAVQRSVFTGHAAAGSKLPMFIFGTDHGLRPRDIYFSGDGGDVVGDLRWSSWTSSHATGEGQSSIQGCIPDCATGAEITVPTSIVLRDPVDGYFTRIIERRDGQNETWFYKDRPSPGHWPRDGYTPTLKGPAVSLEYYWGYIDTDAYAKAWTYLNPAVETETAFIDGENAARPTNIELQGTLTGISGTHATIVINRLITHDQQYGCRSWSGHYDLTQGNGRWFVASASISPKAC